MTERPPLRIGQSDLKGAGEVHAETGRALFVPGLRLQQFVQRLGRKTTRMARCSVTGLPLERRFAHSLPWHGSLRRCLMSSQTTAKFLALFGTDGQGIGAVVDDAVPNLFDELELLGQGQRAQIKRHDGHLESLV